MPEMPAAARALVTSPPYRLIARRLVLPWVLQGERPAGEGLEIGAGSGAMAAQLLTALPRLQMVVTDYDAAMVAAAGRTLAPFGDRVPPEYSVGELTCGYWLRAWRCDGWLARCSSRSHTC